MLLVFHVMGTFWPFVDQTLARLRGLCRLGGLVPSRVVFDRWHCNLQVRWDIHVIRRNFGSLESYYRCARSIALSLFANICECTQQSCEWSQRSTCPAFELGLRANTEETEKQWKRLTSRSRAPTDSSHENLYRMTCNRPARCSDSVHSNRGGGRPDARSRAQP